MSTPKKPRTPSPMKTYSSKKDIPRLILLFLLALPHATLITILFS
ncbi:MAG TPA: hypothetical protein O0X39_06040 [Methanocorpusculum sp.]|nr:hypothetical protein [Methanocorpusculum sp.]